MIFALVIGCASLRTIELTGEAETVVEQGSIFEDLLGSMGFSDWASMNLIESSELQNQGVSPGDIESVKLTLIEFEVTAPQDGDLSFISDMDLYAKAPDVDEVLVASQSDWPEGEPIVDMVLEDVDLTEHVVSESMTLTTDVTAHRPEDDTTITARYAVEVTATVQGIRNQL